MARVVTRLDMLLNLRDQVDAEIARERRTLGRIARLRNEVSAALVAPGGSWTQRILAVAAEAFDVTADDLTGRSKDSDVVQARHVATWLLREAGRSYPEIGRVLGRDHSTAMNGVRRVEASPVLLAVAVDLRTRLLGERRAG